MVPIESVSVHHEGFAGLECCSENYLLYMYALSVLNSSHSHVRRD